MSDKTELEQANQILSDACAKALNERDQWREVAGRLAGELMRVQAQWKPPAGLVRRENKLMSQKAWVGKAIESYDALAKLSESATRKVSDECGNMRTLR